jgi:hypothetical protein
MNVKSASLTLAIAISLTGFATAQGAAISIASVSAESVAETTTTTVATSPMSEPDVRNSLKAQGYTHIHDVEFKGGTWTADAKSADGNRVEVRVDATTGKVIPDEPVATIDKDAIVAKLLAASYTDVHGVEFDDGVWKAEARNPSGNEVDLKLDPNDGHVIGADEEDAEEHH